MGSSAILNRSEREKAAPGIAAPHPWSTGNSGCLRRSELLQDLWDMRTMLVSLSILFTPGMCWAQIDSSAVHGGHVTEVTPLELAAMMKAGTVHIADCNEEDNYVFAHVPGAKLVVYDMLTPEILPADRDAPLVFYCYSPECPAAGMAAQTALSMGHTHVHLMSAGITGWQDAGLPTEP